MFNKYYNLLLILVLMISIVTFFLLLNPTDAFIEDQRTNYLSTNNDSGNIYSMMGFSQTTTISFSLGFLVGIIAITVIFVILAISFFKSLKTQKILVLLSFVCFSLILLIKIISAIYPLTFVKSEYNNVEILNGFYSIPLVITDSICLLGFVLLFIVFRGINKDLRTINTTNSIR